MDFLQPNLGKHEAIRTSIGAKTKNKKTGISYLDKGNINNSFIDLMG